MSRTARPFITEYKSRSSKSSVSNPPNIDTADKTDSTPPFLHHVAFIRPQTDADDAYEIALKAADALFGTGSPVTHVQEQAPSATVQAATVREGRILPSLNENDDAVNGHRLKALERSPVRPGTDSVKTPRISKASKAQAPSSEGQQKHPSRPRKTAAPDVVAAPAEDISASYRERSSIQKRWVLGTELKSGQKWKRRFCKAAR